MSIYDDDIGEYGEDLTRRKEKFSKAGGTAFILSIIFLVAGSISVSLEYDGLACLLLGVAMFAYMDSAKNRCLYDMLDTHWQLARLIDRPFEQLRTVHEQLRSVNKALDII